MIDTYKLGASPDELLALAGSNATNPYRTLAMRFHPDRVAYLKDDAPPGLSELASEAFKLIKSAHESKTDPTKLASYRAGQSAAAGATLLSAAEQKGKDALLDWSKKFLAFMQGPTEAVAMSLLMEAIAHRAVLRRLPEATRTALTEEMTRGWDKTIDALQSLLKSESGAKNAETANTRNDGWLGHGSKGNGEDRGLAFGAVELVVIGVVISVLKSCGDSREAELRAVTEANRKKEQAHWDDLMKPKY